MTLKKDIVQNVIQQNDINQNNIRQNDSWHWQYDAQQTKLHSAM
jgi:hypothetical protein